MCSSCCPSELAEMGGVARTELGGAGAVSAKRSASRAEQLVRRRERLVEAGRVLPAGLREVRPAAAAAPTIGAMCLMMLPA
jgi:hypothetical protein